MTGSADPCDCNALPAQPHPSTPLLIFGRGQHVNRRLALLIHTGNLGERQSDGAHLLHAPARQALRALTHALTPLECEDTYVLPLVNNQPDYQQVRPLRTWLQRLDTPWFNDATANLRFAYQPILRAHGDLLGFEALMRPHVDGQPIPPPEMLQVAAAHDAARALDMHARTRAIQQGTTCLPHGTSIFVNFAPTAVYHPDICLRTTFRACHDANVDPACLIFEVTETEAYPDIVMLRRVLDRYRDEGMRVALDDLGAGHASLVYLETLRPDFVKLDRALLHGLHDADPRVDLIGALTAYAHALGIQVIAEGIETQDELRLALDLGADAVQGYLLGRPAFDVDPALLASATARLQATRQRPQ